MKHKLFFLILISFGLFNITNASTYKEIQKCLADAAKIESTQTGTWDASIGMMMYDKHLTMACYTKYPNSVMTKEEKYTEKENKLYDQWQANPYGCLQKKPGINTLGILYQASSSYENVCVDGMTDEEHIKAVKEFEPYVKNPSRFYDKLWIGNKQYFIQVKKQDTGNIKKLIDKIVKDVYGGIYKSDFQKEGVSQKIFKDFLTKKMNEINVKKEEEKQQAIKQKAQAEKIKKQKELEETIKPFSQYVNKKEWQYLYTVMNEHYLHQLELINNPAEYGWETELDKSAAIINTASEFADYILINGSIKPEMVVKKGQEDALRDAIMEDVMRRYPNARALYEQVSQK